MKLTFYSSILFISFLIGCSPRISDDLQKEIDQISNRWVPDKRVALCNFDLTEGKAGHIILKGETQFPDSKTEVLQLLNTKKIVVTDSIIVLPDTAQLKKTWGVVTLSVANIRSKPAHSSELISQAIMGTPVRVLKIVNGWLFIQTPDRYLGWTNESSVQLMDNSEINNWRKSDRLIYVGAAGNIYQDEKLTIVASDLVAGSIVVAKSSNQSVSKVELPDGRSGFVSNQNWINFNQWVDNVLLKGEVMIADGMKFMGSPYLWGGTSSKGMDCSGFVKTVAFLNGAITERDASQQIKHGKEIDISAGYGNLIKGDLLFFGSKQPYRVTHVAMYIGDGKLIHSSGYVHINSLDKTKPDFNEHLAATLLGARRIIGLDQENGFWFIKGHDWYVIK